jgi:N-acylneuraminate cytidylyltransferase/CMP-N,N'-diacetyllegionaminic acid synthase
LKWKRTIDLVVSTDDEEIATVAEEHGAQAPFERPAELATDEASKLPVIKHAHAQMESITDRTYDYVVDLNTTSPIRLVEDIEACFQRVRGSAAHNAYTVTEAERNPYYNMVELDDRGFAKVSKPLDGSIARRQDAPTVYAMNGSVYVYERDHLVETDVINSNRTAILEMPPERSVDIDRPIDLAYVRFLIEEWGVEYD